ncbi:MAG: MmgE/PrpD family protein [Rhizobacter sp.]|nr:MmgE/PrpD family protein [Rhizobacter sp.]
MELESRLAHFVCTLQAGDLPADAARITRLVMLAAVGTGVAGASEDGVAPLRGLLLERGGAGQARTLVYGDRLPAHAAAQLNGMMCRALDYCDAMAPGIHIGSSLIPAAFAAAELNGACSGAEFLAALAVGCELGARFNLTEAMYDGFDPTGVAIVFASTAAAARILRLSEKQTLHALGLAFNRCGGSFQSNIDGTLAVRTIQGWVAQTGIECAQLAQRGISGPVNFLTGVYGYPHLYGRDRLDPAEMVEGLGSDWRLLQMMFKKYPSCGATQGMTELVLQLVHQLDLTPARVRSVEVRLPPYCHKLVGHPFRMGDNPRVNAQFSVQYCVANAIVRGASKLPHFKVEQVADPRVHELIGRVAAVSDAALDARGHTAVDVTLHTSDGQVHQHQLDIAPGYPGNPLSDEQQRGRFQDCMAYAAMPLPKVQIERFLGRLDGLAALPDARVLIDDLTVPRA